MSVPLVSVDVETEIMGAVSVSGTHYNVVSPTVGQMRKILSLEHKRKEAEEESNTGEQIDYLLDMLGVLIPELPKKLAEKLSIASLSLIMTAANKAITPSDDKKK